jgi:hypothetical protein
MAEVNRGGHYAHPGRPIPLEDLILRYQLHVCEEENLDSYLYPCRGCHGGHRYCIRTIQEHLRESGRDPFLMYSMVGGDAEEWYRRQGIWVEGAGQPVPDRNVFDDAHLGTEYGDNLDPFHDIQQ